MFEFPSVSILLKVYVLISLTMDYTALATPPTAVADFCLIPVGCLTSSDVTAKTYIVTTTDCHAQQIGTPTASVSNEVAAVQRLMKASGLTYSMHSAGTTVGTLSDRSSCLFKNEIERFCYICTLFVFFYMSDEVSSDTMITCYIFVSQLSRRPTTLNIEE